MSSLYVSYDLFNYTKLEKKDSFTLREKGIRDHIYAIYVK